MHGVVLVGINNIYTVKCIEGIYQCRIKGKKLKTDTGVYNPIAAGDIVEVETDPNHPGSGMIVSRHERRNSFSRWNRKRGNIQTIAANIDLLVCILSPESPPFRPRFADRVLVNCEDNVEPLIVLNKTDQGTPPEVLERMNGFKSMGYGIHFCSAKTGSGIGELKSLISGKTAAFVGQSGVGKSSVLNAVDPAFCFRVGEVSGKYNKGRHTTCYAVMAEWESGIIIDTPGIREIDPVGTEPESLSHFMRDIAPYIGKCRHSVCLHRDEPDCAVKDAVDAGMILEERYDSYLRMLEDLESRIDENRYKKGD